MTAVTVIVPTYNHPDTLNTALKSILAQTYQDFEIIVVNDAGIDVENIVTELNTNNNITYITHDENKGAAAARNSGIAIAKSKYIAYLDDDDIFYSDHLETLISFIETNDCKIAYTDANYADQTLNGEWMVKKIELFRSEKFLKGTFLKYNMSPVCCFIHEKLCLNEIGLFDESLFGRECLDLWLRFSMMYKFKHIKKTTTEHRYMKNQITKHKRSSTEKFSSPVSSPPIEKKKTIPQIRYDPRTMEPIIEEPAIESPIEKHEEKQTIEEPAVTVAAAVTIIILCWNNLKYTKLCIESIFKYTKQPFQLIVVDQDSHDGTLKYLKKTLNNELIISNCENKGFSRGNNQALRYAKCEYVLMLNNDCEIMRDNWIDLMIDANRSAGIVGAACKKVRPNHNAKTFEYIGNGNEDDQWSYIEGWCVFAKRDIWLALGGFDEKFNPAFSEDSDLSFRAKKLGLKIKAIPLLPVKHYGGISIKAIQGGPEMQSKKNNRLLYCKWITDSMAKPRSADEQIL